MYFIMKLKTKTKIQICNTRCNSLIFNYIHLRVWHIGMIITLKFTIFLIFLLQSTIIQVHNNRFCIYL